MMRRIMVCLLLMCMLTLTARADVPGQTVAGMAERSAQLLASLSLQELHTAAQVQQDRESVERQVLEIIGDGSFASPRAVYLLTRNEADASWPFETAEELVRRTGKTAWWDFLLPGDREENITSLVLAAVDERIFASDMQGSGILVVLREGGAPYVIAWSAADGAAYARGNFLPDEELAVSR